MHHHDESEVKTAESYDLTILIIVYSTLSLEIKVFTGKNPKTFPCKAEKREKHGEKRSIEKQCLLRAILPTEKHKHSTGKNADTAFLY